jgi:hypothetical protein
VAFCLGSFYKACFQAFLQNKRQKKILQSPTFGMTSNTNQLKPYVVVDPITASEATVVGSLSEAPETIPGPSTFSQDLGCFFLLKFGSRYDGLIRDGSGC